MKATATGKGHQTTNVINWGKTEVITDDYWVERLKPPVHNGLEGSTI